MDKNLWDGDKKQLFRELYHQYLDEGYNQKEAKKMAREEADEMYSENIDFALAYRSKNLTSEKFLLDPDQRSWYYDGYGEGVIKKTHEVIDEIKKQKQRKLRKRAIKLQNSSKRRISFPEHKRGN